MKILALDLGTSSARALVLDAAAAPLPGALARRKVSVVLGDDGSATLDGPGYLAGLIGCLDELATGGHLDGVQLVATAAQWHSVVPLGPDGVPCEPVLTWLDTRSTPLPGSPGPTDPVAFHQRTGTWWHRFYWTVRLPWLRQRAGSGPVRFVGLPEYVHSALLDSAPMSVSQASGTGLFDLRNLDWDTEACELAGVRPGELPPLAPPDWRGRLRPEYARRWPALAEARWTAAVGDGAASNVGSGCFDERWAAVTVGTSAAVRLVQPAPPGTELPPLPEHLWRYRVDHEHVVTGRAFSAGGNLYAWARRELRLPDGPALEAALSLVAPGAGTPADPRFGGDRPPGLAPAGSGRIWHIGFGTTAVDIFAGLMYALCQQVTSGVAELESTVGRSVDAVLGGGAVSASAWWRRAFAVALAPREVRHVGNPEIGATGAALLAIGRPTSAVGRAGIVQTDDCESPTAAGTTRPQYPS